MAQLNVFNNILADFKRNKLATLYTVLYPSLLLYASRNLGVKYAFLAEDCVQNAVFSAWQCRDGFETVNALKSFLYVTIRNQTVSILRKHGASDRYLLTTETDTEFENSVIEQEMLSILHDVIKSMPEKYARILQLSYFEGKKTIEIAEELNVSESTVKKNKAAALALLRERLTDIYGDTIALLILFTFFF